MRRFLGAAVAAATLAVSAARAQDSAEAAPPAADPRSHWAILGGLGHTAQFVTSDETKAFLLLAAPQWSYRVSRVVEAVAEGHLAGYVGNADGWFAGVVPIGLRFQVYPKRRCRARPGRKLSVQDGPKTQCILLEAFRCLWRKL